LIDVKWMPLKEATLRVARNLASLYATSEQPPRQARRTLILAADIPDSRQRWIRDEFGTDIWGRKMLLELARGKLRDKLKRFLARSDAFYARMLVNPPTVVALPLKEMSEIEERLRAERQDAFVLALSSDPTESRLSGEQLCRELARVPRGKKGAKAYEKIVERIFAFLFPGDLVLSEPPEKRTEDDLSIYDIAFRIRNRTEFWAGLARDLRSRILIVECKNYVDPIRAMQVYTTERYLSPSALRSVAFIVTRSEPDATAIAAASGALRESGKLIVFLEDEALCAMLHARDLQLSEDRQNDENDPAEVINARLHRFLARLPR
jgi:hypothetical protein